MRVVVALGGNALLRRGEEMTSENQRENVRVACDALAPVAMEHELVVSHDIGPQVGLLALQGAAYEKVPTYPLDVLGADFDWAKPTARAIARAHPDALMEHSSEFAAGSMLPKVAAACDFARSSGGKAAIGGLSEIGGMLEDKAGTIVSADVDGIEYSRLNPGQEEENRCRSEFIRRSASFAR